MGSLAVSVVLVAVFAYVLVRFADWFTNRRFLMVTVRVLTGGHPDGKVLTDAGLLRPGTKALTKSGHAPRYWHRPRLHRMRINLTVLAAVIATLYGLVAYRWQTVTLLGLAALAGVALAVRALVMRHRRKTWLLPLHLAAHELAGHPRAALASSWITVDLDESRAVKAARLELTQGWPADEKDKQRLVATAAAKLGIEAPEASWRLAGPAPMLSITQSEPPPGRVALADVREAIDASGPSDLVWGIGKQAALVKTSLAADSPHIGLSMGSGAGKSVTARALLSQRLYKGDIGLILDIKMISHQWARDLPNVHIARRPHEIHRALLWLHGEVMRRNEVALAGSDIEGNVHSVVGARLIVVCEELNATVQALRRYWNDIRESDSPKRSPALDGLDFASFTGRQALVNLLYIAQRLSVKASGGDGDARENVGVIGFGRYSASNWKMLAPDHPMPPSSRAPGRLQVVTARVRETQGVFMSAHEARALALAGIVTPLPAGMPGAGRVAGETHAQIPSGDLGVVSGTGTPRLRTGHLMTLSEIVAEGVVSCSLTALRKASQRPGFPARKGLRGVAGEYDPLDLAEWDAVRK